MSHRRTIPQLNEVEREFIATMIDTDGNITLTHQGRVTPGFRIGLYNQNRPILEKAKSILGNFCSVILQPSRECLKLEYSTHLAYQILTQVLDRLIVKRAEAELCMELFNKIKKAGTLRCMFNTEKKAYRKTMEAFREEWKGIKKHKKKSWKLERHNDPKKKEVED